MLPRSIERRFRRLTHRVRVYLGTGHVAADLLAGGGKRHLCGIRESIGTEAGPDGALTALSKVLGALREQAGDLRGIPCEVVIADGWIVYDVVPIDVMQVPAETAASVVAATLADVAGQRADSLEVRWQWEHDGRGAFAMAMPRALLSQVHSLLAQAELDVRSVTGEFVAVYNVQRTRMTGHRVVFAVQRESGAQIALLADGGIRATRYELGRNGSAGLSRAAAGVMRARGDDTTADIDYVLDPGQSGNGNQGDTSDDAHGWSTVNPPTWTSAR